MSRRPHEQGRQRLHARNAAPLHLIPLRALCGPTPMSQHRKPSGRDASGRILYAGPWWFKFKPHGQPPVTGYGYATREAAAAAEAAARKAAERGRIEELRAILRPAASVTVGQLAAEWTAAGCPRPNRRPRSAGQITTQTTFLGYALEWWSGKAIDHIKPPHLGDYAEHRRRTVRAGSTGDRTIDVELGVLSNLFQWAIATGRAESNPFATRARFQASEDVDHCHAYMPASDEELHALIGHLMRSANPVHVVAGAQLLFQAFTGLRPGEPGLLRWDAAHGPAGYAPGHRRESLLDGTKQELLAVARLKRGQNPIVIVHPPLRDFLTTWRAYCAAEWPASPFYFPNPARPDAPLVAPGRSGHLLNEPLAEATAALKLPARTAHAMRAYHVRVLRSQGVLDATIAARLGQSGGARLIETVYGSPTDAFGDGRFDYLPDPQSNTPPAWTQLHASTSNIIAL